MNFELEEPKVHIDRLKQLANEIYPNTIGWTLSVTYWEDGDYSVNLVHGNECSITTLYYQKHTHNSNCEYPNWIHDKLNHYIVEKRKNIQREENEILERRLLADS